MLKTPEKIPFYPFSKTNWYFFISDQNDEVLQRNNHKKAMKRMKKNIKKTEIAIDAVQAELARIKNV